MLASGQGNCSGTPGPVRHQVPRPHAALIGDAGLRITSPKSYRHCAFSVFCAEKLQLGNALKFGHLEREARSRTIQSHRTPRAEALRIKDLS